MVFLENSPLFMKSETIATNSLIGIPYHAFGMGVIVKW
jgi:hypothetical protein